MMPEEIERKIESHDRSLDTILVLAADNERRLSELREGISQLLRIAQLHQSTVEEHHARLEEQRALIEETRRDFRQFLERFDVFLRGRQGDGNR